MTIEQTVRVEPIEGYHALRMTWKGQVLEQDMRDAFTVIYHVLEASDVPMFIHVDMGDGVMLAMTRTVMSALKVYRHPKLEAWLVTGASNSARNVGGVLAAMTGRRNIRWVSSEEAVYNFLNENAKKSSESQMR